MSLCYDSHIQLAFGGVRLHVFIDNSQVAKSVQIVVTLAGSLQVIREKFSVAGLRLASINS